MGFEEFAILCDAIVLWGMSGDSDEVFHLSMYNTVMICVSNPSGDVALILKENVNYDLTNGFWVTTEDCEALPLASNGIILVAFYRLASGNSSVFIAFLNYFFQLEVRVILIWLAVWFFSDERKYVV